jgi:hypothetical protein
MGAAFRLSLLAAIAALGISLGAPARSTPASSSSSGSGGNVSASNSQGGPGNTCPPASQNGNGANPNSNARFPACGQQNGGR